MRCSLIVLSLTLASMPAIGVGDTPQLPMAAAILSESAAFATQIETQMRRNDASVPAVISDIRDDLTNASEWRFHPRGRGILIAIPTKKNLLISEKTKGESEVIDIAERLLSQKDLSGRIEVVFIEPAALDIYNRKSAYPLTGSPIYQSCFCE